MSVSPWALPGLRVTITVSIAFVRPSFAQTGCDSQLQCLPLRDLDLPGAMDRVVNASLLGSSAVLGSWVAAAAVQPPEGLSIGPPRPEHETVVVVKASGRLPLKPCVAVSGRCPSTMLHEMQPRSLALDEARCGWLSLATMVVAPPQKSQCCELLRKMIRTHSQH